MEEEEISLNEDLLVEAQIPKSFWPLGRNTFWGNHEALNEVERFIKALCKKQLPIRMGLLLYGPPQSCRTFLLTYALKMFMAFGYSAYYCDTPFLVDGMLTNKNAVLMINVRQANFLGVDDVTKEPGSVMALERAMSGRIDRGNPTLIATTLEPKVLYSQFGEKMQSFMEMALVVNTNVDVEKRDKWLRRNRFQ